MPNQRTEPSRRAVELRRAAVVLGATLGLAGCALTPPGPAPAPVLPAAWSAPPPHGGSTTQLATWWSQFDDPLVAQLVEAAQQNNGDVAQAAARIAQARANLRFAGGGQWPQVNAVGELNRVGIEVPGPTLLQSAGSAGIDALWEIDVFGVTRNNVRAARARAESAQAAWHDLRVSLAAEVASTYVNLRECEMLVDVFAQDSTSQARTAELIAVKAGAGLESRANSALSGASAADAANRLRAQRAECDVLIKNLVALTTLTEPALRAQLAARQARLPQPAAFGIESVPAAALMQRPDLAALERDVLAASGEVGAAQADRYPRLSLAGTISLVDVRALGARASGTNWSVGPALSLPLFDGGRRAASVEAAQARYDEARARYEQRAREAVREVESALVRLAAASDREADAQKAAAGFRVFLDAAQARWQVGAESLLDLEVARRNALIAAAALASVQRERVAAWITLYKAAGGGWTADSLTSTQVSHYR